MLKYLLLPCLAFFFIAAKAQLAPSSSYRHFTTRDGLPSTQVQGLFEDSQGYIWTITDRGASVYDGYQFRTYTMKNGLPASSVLLINEDHKGRIWFMCNNGAYCFLEGDSILTYKGNEQISKLLKDKLPGPFYFDDKDTMWVTTFSGIQLFKCFGDSVKEFVPSTSSLPLSPTYYLHEVGDKLVNLQVGETSDENKIVATDKLSYLLSVAGECKLACSVKVEENKWVLSGPGGYVVFDNGGSISAHFNSSPYVFSSMDHDRGGHLWLTNSNGAYRLDHYDENPDSANVYFEGHFITAIVQDRCGNYWFGDRDNGVYFVPSLDMQVFQSPAEGKSRKIVSLKMYDGRLHYSDASGKVFVLDNGLASSLMSADVQSGVGLDFAKTATGDFVVGNKPHLFLSKKDEVVTLPIESVIRKSLTLKDGSCAFALADGIAFMDRQNKWMPVDRTVFKERSNALYEDEDSTLWIGTNSGLFYWKDGSIHPCDSLNRLKPRIVDIAPWKDYLVLATRTLGLIFLKGNEFFVFNEKNGMLSDIMDCVAVSDDGKLWIGQAGGIQRMEVLDLPKREISLLRINTGKGLPSNEINDIFPWHDQIYIATNNGLVVFDGNSVSLQGSSTRVKIESFDNGELSLPLDSNLALRYDQVNLRFRFSALNFRTSENTVYRYRLHGINDAWMETTNRSAEYWSLPPGSYTFEVSAMNEDGIWSEATGISFSIAKHFSATWWFRILVAIIVISLMAGIFYFYYRSRRKKIENKAKMLELRQQALNANMNPHFIFNSLNSIQHFINSNRNREANEYLADFSRLIRMNLETNRFNMVALEDELERLELYLKLEQLRFGEKLEYEIENEEGLNYFDLQIPPMLLQPYVENALLHGILPGGREGRIVISVRRQSNAYSITIEDNGIGINESRRNKTATQHQSLALKMNEERLNILKDQTGEEFGISVNDRSESGGTASGTVVRIILPLDSDE